MNLYDTPTTRRTLLASLCFLFAVNGLAQQAADTSEEPNAAGVGNFHQVAPHIYRGGQPTADGFKNLSKMGIKIVLDLRAGGDEGEKKVVESLGMKYVHVPMHGMSRPTNGQIADALKVLSNKDGGPIFVHCKRGADRTGTVIACYRMTHEDWTAVKALAEAKKYGMSPFQKAMMSYIMGYQPPPGAKQATTPPANAAPTASGDSHTDSAQK